MNFLLGQKAYFQRRSVSFREGISVSDMYSNFGYQYQISGGTSFEVLGLDLEYSMKDRSKIGK